MTTEYMPETSTMSCATGVIGLYRLIDGASWRQVCDPKTKRAIIFPTAHAALKAARDVLLKKLNPHLRSDQQVDEPEDDPDILDIENWRKQQQETYAKARAMVKNGKNRRQFVVERKGRKAR